jgi:hypothetical protein
MLSKCANPECCEQFLYLHQGKLFHLSPTPDLQLLNEDACSPLYERFWLCAKCAEKVTISWDGRQATVVKLLRSDKSANADAQHESIVKCNRRRRAASASHRGR